MIGSLHTEHRGANFLKTERQIDTEYRQWQIGDTQRLQYKVETERTSGLPFSCDFEPLTFLLWVCFLNSKIRELDSVTVKVLIDHTFWDIGWCVGLAYAWDHPGAIGMEFTCGEIPNTNPGLGQARQRWGQTSGRSPLVSYFCIYSPGQTQLLWVW